MDFLNHPLVWIVGLALTGFLVAAGSFLVWKIWHAHARREDRRDSRDLLRPEEEPRR